MPRMRKPLAGFSFAMTGNACSGSDSAMRLAIFFASHFSHPRGLDWRRTANPSRFGSASVSGASTLPPENHGKRLAGFDDDFRVLDFFHLRGEHCAQFLACLGWDASGAAVGAIPFRTASAVAKLARARTSCSFHPEAERFDHAAATEVEPDRSRKSR